MIIKAKCPQCGKTAVLGHERKIAGTKIVIRVLQCGHPAINVGMSASDWDKIKSISNKSLYAFQKRGAQFGIDADGRVLIADEMGLGKTIQAAAMIAAHPEMAPIGVICKSGLKIQWAKQIVDWCGESFVPQVFDGAAEPLLPGLKCYIWSLDALRRYGPKIKKDKQGNVIGQSGDTLDVAIDKLCKAANLKTIIIDECQLIKNSESQRTNAVRMMCRNVEHVIALSGTPIKNHAAEYGPILNILRPDKIPSIAGYERTWVETYWDGYKMKYGGLKNPEAFKEFTKDFIIRRTRKEVMPDLPAVSRNYEFRDLGEKVEEAYKKTFKEFQDYYLFSGDGAFEKQSNILAYLSKMRHLAGLSLIEHVIDWVMDFLGSTDRKISIFVHHKDVGIAIRNGIEQRIHELESEGEQNGWGRGVLQLSADLSSEARDECVTQFQSDEYRVLVASTLASGEGLNLQFCSDCVMVERQWNPANEEQAEARFIRIGQLADKVTATYFIAVGTVVEFFSELVEKKRAIVMNTLDGVQYKWDESNLMRELAAELAMKGGQRWGW